MKKKLVLIVMPLILASSILGKEDGNRRWQLTAELGYVQSHNIDYPKGLFLCTGLQLDLGKKNAWALELRASHFNGSISYYSNFDLLDYYYICSVDVVSNCSMWTIDTGVLYRFRLNDKINTWVEAGARQLLKWREYYFLSWTDSTPGVPPYEEHGNSVKWTIDGFLGLGLEWKLYPSWGFRASLLEYTNFFQHAGQVQAEVKAGVFVSL